MVKYDAILGDVREEDGAGGGAGVKVYVQAEQPDVTEADGVVIWVAP